MIFLNKKAKYMLSAVGEHFLYIVMSFVLILIFGAMLHKILWLLSIITALVYLSAMYSTGWSNSGKDMRAAKSSLKLGESDTLDYRIYDGFIYAIPLLALSVIVLVLNLIFGSYLVPIFRVYNVAFVYLLDIDGKSGIIVDIIATVLPYLCYGIGYIMGKDKRVFLVKYINKLVYKSSKNQDKLRK